jgi:regulator of protease activity HflC (stomatin/prohibitin superfamily)
VAELLRLVWDLVALLKPWREVTTWEKGLLYRFGVYRRTLEPGWHVVVPFVHTVHVLSVVREAHIIPCHSVTLVPEKSGQPPVIVTYSATVEIEIEDAALAWNSRGHYLETSLRIISGRISQALREEDEDRFNPSRRVLERFLARLVGELDEVTRTYGVRVKDLTFSDFLIGARAIRLLGEVPTSHAVAKGP